MSFPTKFTETPVVIITGHWDGGPSGVDRPDILLDIDTDSFKVISHNKTPTGGPKYYINWIAIGNMA